MVQKIAEKEFDGAINGQVAVVDFSAVWCGPCKMLAPLLEEVSEELGDKAVFLNVDVDENPNLAVKYGIQNIPAVLILKDGEKVDQQIGFQPKENLTQLIQKYI